MSLISFGSFQCHKFYPFVVSFREHQKVQNVTILGLNESPPWAIPNLKHNFTFPIIVAITIVQIEGNIVCAQ
jgi:hypothetical protein